MCMRDIAEHSNRIVTISEFSKREICQNLGVDSTKISVIYPSWDHMDRIQEDINILPARHLEDGTFYFALGSLMPHKNIEWIIRAAMNNPNEVFVIAGRLDTSFSDVPRNVQILGYVTDSEAKALMSRCRAFISPSKYEGFGLPPLEAVASGCTCLLLSDIEIYHEVYGDCANYFDSSDYSWKIPKNLHAVSAEESRELLTKYSIEQAASAMIRELRAIQS